MLKIRLARAGKRNSPFFRVVLTEHTAPSKSGYKEVLGFFNPISKEFKEIKKYSTNVEALLDLEARRIDAVVLDEIVARYYIAQKEKKDNKTIFKVLDGDFGKEEYGIGIRKEDSELKKAIDEFLLKQNNETKQ